MIEMIQSLRFSKERKYTSERRALHYCASLLLSLSLSFVILAVSTEANKVKLTNGLLVARISLMNESKNVNEMKFRLEEEDQVTSSSDNKLINERVNIDHQSDILLMNNNNSKIINETLNQQTRSIKTSEQQQHKIINNNNNSNNDIIDDDDDYDIRKELKLPLYMRILASIACLIIFVIGVTGNLLVPLVVIKTKYLRNSTNLFLINLSISDLLVLIVCMPTVFIELHSKPEIWLLGESMCKYNMK